MTKKKIDKFKNELQSLEKKKIIIQNVDPQYSCLYCNNMRICRIKEELDDLGGAVADVYDLNENAHRYVDRDDIYALFGNACFTFKRLEGA